MKLLKIMTAFILSAIAFGMNAQNYVVIGQQAQVFDGPSAKSYATTNQQSSYVFLFPGMVFPKVGTQNGWDKVIYTPGLTGFILNSLETPEAKLGTPKPGKYTVANDEKNKESVTIADNGNGSWSLTSPNGTFEGKQYGKIVVFLDKFTNPVYSLVVLGGKPIVMSYDNAVTYFL